MMLPALCQENADAISSPQTLTITVHRVSSGPDGITTGADGALWFTESAANKIGRIVLKALEETENALVNFDNERGRRSWLEEAVRASQTALDLAQIQYRAGLADFLTVLDSERTLAGNQDQLAQGQVNVIVNLISLYKALGGGWEAIP